MKIREAKPKELAQITRYGNMLLKQHADIDPYFAYNENVDSIYRDFLEECLHSENKLLLVAEIKGKLVGYAAGVIQARSPMFQHTENGYINDVFVEKEFRKLGIAREFLTVFKNWFKTKDIKYIELSVLAKNEPGKKTWAKFGFEPYEIKERVEISKFNI